MAAKKRFSLKIAALSIAATTIFAGAAATIAQTVINKNSGNPFILIFTNGQNKNANSKYRLLGRHQDGYPNNNLSDKLGNWNHWETGFGISLDNSNPVVQAEQLNWLYYLLFFSKTRGGQAFKASHSSTQNVSDSTFDGIRIDCGDGVDSDILGQTNELLDDLYDLKKSDANANDHLSFNEGYGPNDAINEKKYFHNGALNYDDSYYMNMSDNLMWYEDGKAPFLYDAKALISNQWNDDEYEDSDINPINPNLIYSQNHDNFNQRIWDLTLLNHPDFSYQTFNDKEQSWMDEASRMYYANLASKDKTFKGKQISPKNQVSLYADMLINKDTVPIVFYGDIFEGEKDYMSTPSAISEPIMDILEARSKYVAGGQQRKVVDDGKIITNVRFGKGYYDGRTKVSDKSYIDSKNSGIVTIFSNNQKVNVKNLKIYVGKNHAGKQYQNLIDTTNDIKADYGMGLTMGPASKELLTETSGNVMGTPIQEKYRLTKNKDHNLIVDENGYLILPQVKGVSMPFVDGYLSMWVPADTPADNNVYVDESTAQTMNSYSKSKEILNSNSALDSHVLYQDFSVNVPDQGHNGSKDNSYKELANHAKDIAESGITDVWMAPPYISPDQTKNGQLRNITARYGYGYMMSDRYNLGEEGKTSKYGNADDLVAASAALHGQASKITGRNLKLMADFIPHQIIRGDDSEKEEVTFNVYNGTTWADPIYLGGAHVTRKLQTKTSKSNLQYEYGGKYLEDIHDLFPDLFKTPALSTGECLPFKEKIQRWSAKYENAYPLEFGIDGSNEFDGSNSNNLLNNKKYDGYYLSKRH